MTLRSSCDYVNIDDMNARTTYHHGDLRAAVLAAARRRVELEGEAALSVRACARDTGVDTAAVYRHFRRKEDVLAALAAEGFAELAVAMERAMSRAGRTPSRARRRFLACGSAYVRFGLEHPRLYELMFGGRCSIASVRKAAEAITVRPRAGPYELLGEALDLLAETGSMAREAREGAELVAWSQVHGLVSLVNDGHGADGSPPVEELAERHLSRLIDGLADHRRRHGS